MLFQVDTAVQTGRGAQSCAPTLHAITIMKKYNE